MKNKLDMNLKTIKISCEKQVSLMSLCATKKFYFFRLRKLYLLWNAKISNNQKHSYLLNSTWAELITNLPTLKTRREQWVNLKKGKKKTYNRKLSIKCNRITVYHESYLFGIGNWILILCNFICRVDST